MVSISLWQPSDPDAPVVRDTYVRVFGVSYRVPFRRVIRNETTIAVNVGGAVIPILISAYLLIKFPSSLLLAGTGILIVTIITHSVAKPIRGIGIATPALVPPLAAALAAILLTSIIHIPNCPIDQCRVVVAYTGGVLEPLLEPIFLTWEKLRILELRLQA